MARFEEVVYLNYRSVARKQLVNLSGLVVNTLLGTLIGYIGATYGADSTWSILMMVYGLCSVSYAVFCLPAHVRSLEWLCDRSKKEVAEVIHINPGFARINGVEWEVAYDRKCRIVLDCSTGIAHFPVNSLERRICEKA